MLDGVFPSQNSFSEVNDHLFIPALYALKEVEKQGFTIDMNKFLCLEEGYTVKLNQLEDRVRSYPEVLSVEKKIDKKFNLNSGDQIHELFFVEMGLSPEGIEPTDSGKRLSTGKKTIAKLKDKHEIVELINQHKKYATLYKMFVKPLRKHICLDGRVHCVYLPLTKTGRLICFDPNLQQIPKNIKAADIGFDFDPALNIKTMYIPFDKDYLLMEADYSQMELRILAAYCQDEVMKGILLRGEDIHLATGQAMADIVEPGVIVDKDSKWRKAAKTINFGIIYGEGDKALAEALHVTEKEAKQFKRNYFDSMPGVETFLDDVYNFVYENRYVTTMFGNYRRLLGVTSPQKFVRFEALRQALNMPIQGTAGQYTICAIINIIDIIRKYKMKSRIIATIHDSIMFCVHKDEIKQMAEIAQTVMANPTNPLIYWDLGVPLKADLKLSENSWADLKDFTP